MYLTGMPWLTAGMTLVPSEMPDVEVARADERDHVVVGAVAEGHLEPGVLVVARLVGEVERGELDARDEPEADAPA